jgi:hypothetical protein
MKSIQTVLASIVMLALGVTAATATPIFAITSGGRLISFDSSTPGSVLTNVAVSGVAGALIGIDFRPATGQLYAVGNNGGVGTVYTLSSTGATTPVYTLTTALAGTNFGVDFNPVADALRIVSNTGQNLRIAGFASSAFLTNIDGALSLTDVVGAGYSNNVAGASSTTLYVIRSTDGALYTQNPPNNGTLNLVGSLGTIPNDVLGFDVDGSGAAFASLNSGQLFGTVDLLTGAFTGIGPVSGFSGQVTGISVGSAAAVPEASIFSMLIFGLVSFIGYTFFVLNPWRGVGYFWTVNEALPDRAQALSESFSRWSSLRAFARECSACRIVPAAFSASASTSRRRCRAASAAALIPERRSCA